MTTVQISRQSLFVRFRRKFWKLSVVLINLYHLLVRLPRISIMQLYCHLSTVLSASPKIGMALCSGVLVILWNSSFIVKRFWRLQFLPCRIYSAIPVTLFRSYIPTRHNLYAFTFDSLRHLLRTTTTVPVFWHDVSCSFYSYSTATIVAVFWHDVLSNQLQQVNILTRRV